MRERKRSGPRSEDGTVPCLHLSNRSLADLGDGDAQRGIWFESAVPLILLLFAPAALSFWDLPTVDLLAFCYHITHQRHHGTLSLGVTARNALEKPIPNRSGLLLRAKSDRPTHCDPMLLRESRAVILRLRARQCVSLEHRTQVHESQIEFNSRC